MKKMIAWVITLCLICSMSACVGAEEKKETTGAENTAHQGLSVEVLKAYRKADDVILEVLWKNHTQYDIIYGEMFEIYRWEEGHWNLLEMKENTGFISIGYRLEAGDEVQKNYKLGWVYDLSKPGNYRFSTSCRINDGNNNLAGSECHLYAEFTLGEKITGTETVSVPQLTVYSGTEQVEVLTGGYAWAQYHSNGKVAHTIADAMHPLQAKSYLSNYETTNDRIRLDFSCEPDSWTVRCWPDYMFRDGDVSMYDSQSDEVMVYDNEIYLKPAVDGGYVYEITAIWEESETESYGRVTYILWINSYPVEPLTSEIMPRQ